MMIDKKKVILGTCCLCTLISVTSAKAQSGINNVPILNFEPSPTPYGVLTTDTSKTLPNLEWYVGVMTDWVPRDLELDLSFLFRQGMRPRSVLSSQISD